MIQLALLGKHPCHGDFLRRGWPGDLDTRLLDWIDATFGALMIGADQAWDSLGATSRHIRFWVGQAVLGRGLAGVLAFSCDRVGRRYPLVLAAVDALPTPFDDPDQGPYEVLWHRLASASDAEGVSELTDVPAIEAAPRAQVEAQLCALRADGALGRLLADVAVVERAAAAAGRSCWWVVGDGPAALLAVPGLPGSDALAWLLAEAVSTGGLPAAWGGPA